MGSHALNLGAGVQKKILPIPTGRDGDACESNVIHSDALQAATSPRLEKIGIGFFPCASFV